MTITATKSVAGPFYRGGLVTYTIVLTNTGPGAQANNPGPEFVDALPAGMTGDAASATSGTMSAGGAEYRHVEWEPGERRLGDDHDHRKDRRVDRRRHGGVESGHGKFRRGR